MRNIDYDDRFEEVYKQGGVMGISGHRIILDKETGVQYFLTWNGSSSGVTPLIDKDGKPLIKLT